MAADGGETKRKRRRRKEARPAEIAEAGFAEFAEKGFLATRLEDVAARAGVVKGTIYRYFESKEALFEAALRARISPSIDGLEALIDSYDGSSEALLRRMIETVYLKVADGDFGVVLRIIVSEGRQFPALVDFHHRATIVRSQALLEKIVARGVSRGEFRESALTDLPMALIAPALMAAVWRMTFDRLQPIALERFLEAHLELALGALRADPPA